jgi:hypothetical protein
MKPNDPSAHRLILALVAMACPLMGWAQAGVTEAPPTEQLPPGLRDLGPKTESKPSRPAGSFFSAGPLSLHPHLSIRTMYGLGLPAPDGRHVASMIYMTAPGLRIDFGSQWSLDYVPNWVSYTANALQDTLDHALSFQGAGRAEEWFLQFSENYGASAPILFETGRQTKQTTWATQLTASRSIGTTLNFSTSASLNERYSEVAPDTRDWATMNWLTKSFSKQFQAGLGLGAGYSDIVGQPDGTNERYMGKLNWSPTDKLALSVDGGVEARHSRASAAKDMHNPLLNGSLVYRPFVTTTLSMSAAKTVSNSYFDKQVTKGSSWSISAEQRLLGRLYLSTSYSRQVTEFESVTTLIPILVVPEDPTADPTIDLLPVSLPGRSDHTESLSARLSTVLLKRLTLAVTYSRNRNRSSQTGFTFTTTQYGLEIGCQY